MERLTFINLPVADLDASVDFFTKLGFSFDERFTDDAATMMIVNEQTSVMLLTHERFMQFTSKQICDTSTHTELLLGISAQDRQAVDALVDAALTEGATAAREPQEHDFMYGRSFHDLDGHTWEVIWMDVDAATAGSET